MSKPERLAVLVSQAVDEAISQLLPAESSGDHDLPCPDIRLAEFQDLLVPLATVTGQRVYNFTGVGQDHILLTKLAITPTRETYTGDDPGPA